MAETGPQKQPDEAMLDLLIKQVTEGLSPEEQRELDVLDNEAASAYARDLEHAAAAISVAGTAQPGPMPAALRARIEAQLETAVRASTSSGRGTPRDGVERRAATSGTAAVAAPRREARPAGGPRPRVWCSRCSAGCALRPCTWPGASAADTNAMRCSHRQSRRAADSTRCNRRTGGGRRQGRCGVGSSHPTRLLARFVGLKPNDPAQHQYQLWIFDGDRDQRYPVDGGVFNVPANADQVVVPIRAQLTVHEAKAFAVTIEQPGGVVVSGREHVVAIGKAG